MRKIVVIFLFVSSFIYSYDFPDIYHGISVGNIAVNYTVNSYAVTSDILSYRILEADSGFGLTTYLLNLDVDPNSDKLDIFAMEINFEPFFNIESLWGIGLFYRVDNYLLFGNCFEWQTGLRFDFRAPIDDLIYPLIVIEAGYNYKNMPYISLKADSILWIFILVSNFLEDQSDNTPDDYGPKFVI